MVIKIPRKEMLKHGLRNALEINGVNTSAPYKIVWNNKEMSYDVTQEDKYIRGDDST